MRREEAAAAREEIIRKKGGWRETERERMMERYRKKRERGVFVFVSFQDNVVGLNDKLG